MTAETMETPQTQKTHKPPQKNQEKKETTQATISKPKKKQQKQKQKQEQKRLQEQQHKQQAESPLVAACRRGALDEVEALVLAQNGWESASHALQEACAAGHVQVAKLLVEHGVDIEVEAPLVGTGVRGKRGTALIAAIFAGHVAVCQYLLSIGANVNAKEAKQSVSAFAFAAQQGRLEIMKLLIEHGADIAMDTPLKLAVGGSESTIAAFRLEILHFLTDLGLDPNSATQYGGSVIHAACGSGSLAMLALLIDRGFDIHVTDSRGWTPLHSTCYTPNAVGDKIALLLARGAVDDLAIESKDGLCPMHLLLRGGNHTVARLRKGTKAKLVKLFMDAGADPNVKCRNGKSPLAYALFENGSASEDILQVIRLLCAHGAVWDASCDQHLGDTLEKTPKLHNTDTGKDAAYIAKLRKWRTGMRASIRQWQADRVQNGGDALTNIPIEIIQEGEHAVKLYLDDQKSSTMAQKVARSKICVVGPSEWGKTSLVKSVTTLTPSLVHIADRTIGIDLFPLSFQEQAANADDGKKNHAVTFWDFAGQDVYHVAHALFFSKRTLYLLCVDLPSYMAQLCNAEHVSLREHEARMSRFVADHVLRWVETIIVRQPDAEFLVVGTKADKVADAHQAVEQVWVDLKVRLGAWRDAFAGAAAASIASSAGERGSGSGSGSGGGSRDAEQLRLQEMKERLKTAFRDNWIAVSSIDQASVELARQAAEASVVASDKEFVMGNKYNRVLQCIADKREKATQSRDAKTRVEELILPVNYLFRELLREIDDLEVDDCAVILRTLHELGDVLWYDHYGAEALRDCVIIDPTLVIDLVKEVISHDMQAVQPAEAYAHELETVDPLVVALRDEGRMSHELLLRSGTLWRHLDDELTQAFKALLKYFQLAYSADGKDMDWDSDLIVPAYWKIKSRDGSARRQPPMRAHGVLGDHVQPWLAWEYGVSAGVSQTLFDHFAVESNSAQVKRTIGNGSIECFVRDEFVARIALFADDLTRDLIRIEVAALSHETAWLNLRYYVMTMEKVLETCPGLLVSRHVVEIDPVNQNETRHRVGHIVHVLEDAMALGRSVTDEYAARPWLSCDFSWFIEKAWRHPGILQEIQTRAFVRQVVSKADVLRKLIVRGERGRVLPALWTARCDAASGKLELQMLSDLSGTCFHKPLEIHVPSGFVAKHGAVMETGLWICSNVIPEMLTLGLLQKVVDFAAPLVSGTIERTQAVHNLIDKMDSFSSVVNGRTSTQKLSPASSRALLRALLTLHDASFDELRITELANLQCAVSTSGSYIWAHHHEIKAMGDKLIPCDPSRSSPVASSSTSDSIQPSDPANPPSLELLLTVDHLEGLSSWDSYKVLCAWQLVHASRSTPLATGTTEPVTSDADAVTWASTPFPLTGIASLEMLRECRLQIQVKRASRLLGKLKLLGQGVVELSDSVAAFHEPGAPIAKPIVVALEPKSSRVVTCSIAASRLAVGG